MTVRVRTRCRKCQAFVKAASGKCLRCIHAEQTRTKQMRRAEQAIANLRERSAAETWKLSRLRRARAGQRKRLRFGKSRWEPLVRAAFGAGPDDLVDPRQMSLFLTERPCPPSPSPKLSRSA